MNPTIEALRSIGSEFAKRLYVPIAVSISIVIVLLLVGSIWLTTLSGWWWILVTFFIIGSLIVTTLLVATGLLIRTIRPAQSKQQTQQVSGFVDKIQTLTDLTGTPKVVILFRIVRDMATKKNSGYIQSLYGDTMSMQHDFRDITHSFK